MSERNPREVGKRLLAEAHEVCFPRAAGSEGDRRIRTLLSQRLRDIGYEVEEQSFDYQLGWALLLLRGGLLLIALAVLVLGFAAGMQFAGSAVMLAATLALLGAIGLGSSLRFDALYFAHGGRRFASANVIGRQGPTSPRRRAALVAHHDSKSQNISFLWRAALVVLAAASVLVGTAALTAGLFGPLPATWIGAARAAGIVGALCLAGLASISFGNRSPGALDNGASLLIACEVARRLASQPPAGTETAVVFTGAEEHLMVGSRVLARENLPRWRGVPTVVVNLDGAGGPGPPAVVASGSLAARTLAVAQRIGLTARRVVLPPGTATDALPLQRAGARVLTITSGALSRAVLRIHTSSDDVHGLDALSIGEAADWIEAIVRDEQAMRFE